MHFRCMHSCLSSVLQRPVQFTSNFSRKSRFCNISFTSHMFFFRVSHNLRDFDESQNTKFGSLGTNDRTPMPERRDCRGCPVGKVIEPATPRDLNTGGRQTAFAVQLRYFLRPLLDPSCAPFSAVSTPIFQLTYLELRTLFEGCQ